VDSDAADADAPSTCCRRRVRSWKEPPGGGGNQAREVEKMKNHGSNEGWNTPATIMPNADGGGGWRQ